MNRRKQYIEKAARVLIAKRNGDLTKEQYTKKLDGLASKYSDLMRGPDPIGIATSLLKLVVERADEIANPPVEEKDGSKIRE